MPDAITLRELQRHTVERSLQLPGTAAELRRSLSSALVRASNTKKITTTPRDITAYVALLRAPPPTVERQLRERNLHQGAFCLVGGEKNQSRDARLPHFTRSDGAWFDFSIIGRESQERIELLAYDFEIRLMPGMGAPFLRFDLNLPDHHNEDRELRCHMHPGYDDMIVPAPLMSPSEMLMLFIDGIRLPAGRKPRAPTAFEVDWLKHTLARIPGAADGSPT